LGSAGVYALFFASGAAALVYQVLWSRWLGLMLGNTTTSVAIVLSAFMCGLALGSGWIGRRVAKIADPMRWYALIEWAIGAIALLFPLLIQGFDLVYTALVDADTPPAISLAVRAVLAFALLVLPTSLMGATLPLLTEFFRRRPADSASWRVGSLYAMNTLGAAVGILGASFLLIELVGVRATTRIAAGLNFGVAAIGLMLSRRMGPDDLTVHADASRLLPIDAALVTTVLAASGAAAMACEVLWMRAFDILIGNSTYVFATIVLVYLVGIAAGSALFARCVTPQRARLRVWLAGLSVAMAGFALAGIQGYSQLWKALEADRGRVDDMLGFLGLYLEVSLLILPMALLSGAMFPVATRLIEADESDASGARVARVYAWNTLGGVAGSLLAGFVLAPHLDLLPSLYAIGLIYSLLGLGIVCVLVRRSATLRGAGSAIWACGGVALALGGHAAANLRGNPIVGTLVQITDGSAIPFHEPGIQGITTVVRSHAGSRQDRLLVNGHGMTMKVTDTKMMAHLPLLVHPDPEDTLVICFGMGTTYRSALTHGGRVTAVELVPEVLEVFDYYHLDAAEVIRNPKGRRVAGDGRNFLKLTRDRYDVITIDPPPPIDAAGVNHLYSRDFIELARSRLEPGGILAHWIPAPGTHSGVDDMDTFRMLAKTFVSRFRHVSMMRSLGNTGLHLLGSDSPIDSSEPRIRARLGSPEVAADLEEWDRLPRDFWTRIRPLDASRGETMDVEEVTDDRPRLEFHLVKMLGDGRKKRFLGPDYR
jgi:spermidine synthase